MSAEPKIKRMCPECGHKHRNQTYCHAYMEAAVDDDEEEGGGGGGGGGDDEEEEDDEEDDLLGTKMKKEPTFEKKEAASDELPTPFFVQKIRYTRCNCLVGVPLSRDYEQVGRTLMCGNIVVKQYDDIINAIMAPPPRLLTPAEEEVAELARAASRNNKHMEVLPLVMRFLREGHCSEVRAFSLLLVSSCTRIHSPIFAALASIETSHRTNTPLTTPLPTQPHLLPHPPPHTNI